MSIASEITRLQNAKATIKAAIEAKGVTVGDETLDEYADLIGQINTEDEKFQKILDRSIVNVKINTNVGLYTFYGCNALESVVFDNSNNNITILGQACFQGCSALKNITIPTTVSYIGQAAFAGTGISTIDLPNISTLESNVFANAKSLTHIEIPSTITSIKNQAFSGCNSLATVIVRPTTPPTLGSNAFYTTVSGRKIYVPAASVNNYKTATNWSEYANDIEAIPTNS